METIQGLQRDNPGSVLAGLVKQSMQRKAPAFNENDYGYSGFARFLEAAREKSLVSLSKAERAGGYQVDQPRPEGEAEPVEEDDLPVLEGTAANMRDDLASRGFNPVTHMMRHTVVHEFVDHVQERAARKRKNSLKYTVGDTARRCRKTDPPVATRHVRSVINALAQAGQLLHADGTPVRSVSAPFVIQKDAEELLAALLGFYLQTLKTNGHSMDELEGLSQLFYNDIEHVDEISALLKGLASTADTEPVAKDPTPDNDEHAPLAN